MIDIDALKECKDYFSRLVLEGQCDAQYVNGEELTVELINLLKRPEITQDSYDIFLEKLENVDACGSMYSWLWCVTQEWGYEAGLKVPKKAPFPWNNYHKNELLCIDNDAYEINLDIGNWYKIIDDKSKIGYVKIVENSNRHRWFPIECFETKKITIDREFIQKD